MKPEQDISDAKKVKSYFHVFVVWSALPIVTS